MGIMERKRNTKPSIQRTHWLLLGIASATAPNPLLHCTAFLTPPSRYCPQRNAFRITPTLPLPKPLYIYAPPGSGYIDSEDDIPNHPIPESYKPTMGYPGTMRPGETKENQPYSSLPIADTDPDPVPWPHFQEIEWHHNWGSPHEHPIPMEEFIDMHGRWATVEMEAEVRKGARRGLRERREMEESQKTASFILDDDDDDDDDVEGIMGAGGGSTGVKLDLGEGMDVDLMIGSEMGTEADGTKASGDADVEEEEVDDDFLLSLGLDSGDDDDSVDDDDTDQDDDVDTDDDDDDFLLSLGMGDDDGDDNDDDASVDDGDDGLLDVMQSMLDADDDGDDADDSGDDFESDGDQMVPLDDMIGNEDMGDDDAFDDGGFDYD